MCDNCKKAWRDCCDDFTEIECFCYICQNLEEVKIYIEHLS